MTAAPSITATTRNPHFVKSTQTVLPAPPTSPSKRAFQSAQSVSFLTADISARQLEKLAALMDERHCELVHVY
jgi:hypothetical protein